MMCYAAHVVLYVEFRAPGQDRFPVWENVVLVGAESEAEAFEAAVRYGDGEAGDDGGSFRWGGQPARWVFAGVRKITECEEVSDPPSGPLEITYNELVLDSLADVRKFASGGPVTAEYNDRYRPPLRAPRKVGGGPGRGRRRA